MTRILVVVAVALLGVAAAGCHDDCTGPNVLHCPSADVLTCVDGHWSCVPGDSGVALPPPRDLASAPAHD